MSLKTSTLRSTFSSSLHRTTPPSTPLRARTRLPPTNRPYSPQTHSPNPSLSHPTSSTLSSTGTSTITGSSTISGSGTVGGAGLGSAGGAAAGKKAAPSRHIVWYREIVPAMMPVIGIGTAIFFALQLIQTHLSHSRSLSDAQIRITHLESELAHLQSIQRRQAVSWGDSLGRVIKVVQEVAVGPKAAVAAGAEGQAAGVAAGGENGKTGSGKYVDQATSTTGTGTIPVVSSSTTTTGTSVATPVDAGMDALVDRVKGEFGGDVEAGTTTTKPSRWSGWFGAK